MTVEGIIIIALIAFILGLIVGIKLAPRPVIR